MRILIIHLSDIHISQPNDPILSRTQHIANAVTTAAPDISHIVLVIAGDLVDKGRTEEFDLALTFIANLQSSLSSVFPDKTPDVIIVPGNHDCFLPGDQDLRHLVLDQLPIDVLESPSVLTQCLQPLNYFFEYIDCINPINQKNYADIIKNTNSDLINKLIYEYRFETENISILFRCYNSAWTTRRKEVAGALRFPRELLDIHTEKADLVVSVIHHPTNWFKPDEGRTLRRHLESSSDIVLSGHEHDPGVNTRTDLKRHSTLIVEGAVLQEHSEPQISSFNVVVYNLNRNGIGAVTASRKLVQYTWSGTMYTPSDQWPNSWESVSLGPGLHADPLDLSENHIAWLDDPGAALKSAILGEIRLSDIFVWPNLSVQSGTIDDTTPLMLDIATEDLFDFMLDNSRILILGHERSGKTCLAKKLFYEFKSRDLLPLYIDASKFKYTDSDRIDKVITDSIKEQYGQSGIEPYKQRPSGRVALIDNIHNSPLNQEGREFLLTKLHSVFDKIIVFSSDQSDPLRSVLRDDTGLLASYSVCEIEPLSHVVRDQLISNWFTPRGNLKHQVDQEERSRKIIQAHNIVNSIIGNNFIPPYPIFVLTILQAQESQTPINTSASTYGYFYEILILEALGATKRETSGEINMLLGFLSYLAHSLPALYTSFASDDDIKSTYKDYQAAYAVTDKDLPYERTLARLIEARILSPEISGTYRFSYPYIYYYFSARYLRELLSADDDKSTYARRAIQDLVQRTYEEDPANILLFLTHLSRDPYIINSLITFSRTIFSNSTPITLNGDIKLLDGLEGAVREVVRLTEVTYVEQDEESQRRHVMAERDQEARISRDTGRDSIIPSDGIIYAIELDQVLNQLNLAMKTLRLLGQIIKNSPGEIAGDVKLEVAEECYSLGLRTLNATLSYFDQNRSDVIQGFIDIQLGRTNKERYTLSQIENAGVQAQREIVWFAIRLSYGMVRSIAHSVGTPRGLSGIYENIRSKNKDSAAISLIDSSIKLDHTDGFPLPEIDSTATVLEDNHIAMSILRRMVVNHFRLFHVPAKARQTATAKLKIKTVPADIHNTKKKRLPR